MTFAPPFELTTPPPSADSFLELLDLEHLDRDLYRAGSVREDAWALYGGQVAAQALRAAGSTVTPDRLPHSLHGYFLRAGDAARPTLLVVHRSRDGRSFSARHVEAIQSGEVIFSMSASFHASTGGREEQCLPMPAAPDPEDSSPIALPRLAAFEGRTVEQPYPDAPWPTRLWSRPTEDLGDDPLVQACAVTYLSDISNGLAPLSDATSRPGASLDHAVWFHRPARMQDWILMDLVPHVVAGGRGWYSGSIYDRRGQLVATTVQESLFRAAR